MRPCVATDRWALSTHSPRLDAHITMRSLLFLPAVVALLGSTNASAQAPVTRGDSSYTLLTPARVFDGTDMHEGWSVLVRGDRIAAAGPASSLSVPSSAKRMD